MKIQGYKIDVGDYIITEFTHSNSIIEKREGVVNTIESNLMYQRDVIIYGDGFLVYDNDKKISIIKVLTKEKNPEYFL